MRSVAGLVALGAIAAAAPVLAGRRWQKNSLRLARRLVRDASRPAEPIGEGDWDGLPAPVVAYFRRALPRGKEPISRLEIRQAGQLLLNGRWREFTAVQHLSATPPGFVWDARVRMAPGFYTRVRDAYVDGAASMLASVAGLVRIVNERGGRELNAGALYRYLAEATWMPAALLPRHGVTWTPVDASRAVATLTDSGTRVSLEFTFDGAGEVTRIFASSRARALNGVYEPTPWAGRFWNYAERCGMWIPLEGEVSWQIGGAWVPWWRGRVVGVDARLPQPSRVAECRTRA